jgi:hypothetical protein
MWLRFCIAPVVREDTLEGRRLSKIISSIQKTIHLTFVLLILTSIALARNVSTTWEEQMGIPESIIPETFVQDTKEEIQRLNVKRLD